MVDFNLNQGSPIVNDDLAYVLQQIDLLFSTKPTDVLGDSSYGTNYSKFLYDLQISNDAIQERILEDLLMLDLKGYTPYVTVHLLEGTENDIILAEINLYNNDFNYQQIYRISQ